MGVRGRVLQQTNMSIDDQRLAYTAEWSQSLFGCFGDISTCAMGMCCAPCLYGQTSEIAEGDGCVKPCLLAYCCGLCTVCMWAPARRNSMRDLWTLKHGGLAESACINRCCCPSCANCQEASELKSRNFDKHQDWEEATKSVEKAAAPKGPA